MNSLKIIDDAFLICENGTITHIGEMKDCPKFSVDSFEDSQIETIDCTGKTVVPSFVDSHTHLVFGGYRENEFMWRMSGMSYMDIMQKGGGIAKSVELTSEATEEELFKVAKQRVKDMIHQGIGAIEIKSGYGLDCDTELKQLRVINRLKSECDAEIVSTFMGAHSIPKNYKQKEKGSGEYIDFIIKEVLPIVQKEKLAEFVDIFCEKGVFSISESENLLSHAMELGFKTKIHADEIVTLGGAELAVKIGCTSADHLLHASEKGIKNLANSNTIATLLPLTAFCLKEQFANARKLIDSGAAVSIATDFNPGSCFSFSIPLLIALSVIKMNMTINEIITALTLNGACAIDRGETLGTLEVGKKANITILKYPSENFLAYHTGINIVEKTIINGKVIPAN